MLLVANANTNSTVQIICLVTAASATFGRIQEDRPEERLASTVAHGRGALLLAGRGCPCGAQSACRYRAPPCWPTSAPLSTGPATTPANTLN